MGWNDSNVLWFFLTTKKKKKLQNRYDKITNYMPSLFAWTEEQCKALIMEMEKPGTMDYKVLAKRLIFKGKEDKQFENKTAKLRLKKIALLSAAATLDSKKRDVAWILGAFSGPQNVFNKLFGINKPTQSKHLLYLYLKYDWLTIFTWIVVTHQRLIPIRCRMDLMSHFDFLTAGQPKCLQSGKIALTTWHHQSQISLNIILIIRDNKR